MGRGKESEQLTRIVRRNQVEADKSETKRCPCCELNLPLNNFGTDKSRKSGHDCYCKKCKKDKKEEAAYGEGGKAFVICTGCRRRIGAEKYGLMREPYCPACTPNIQPAMWTIALIYAAG